MKNKIDKEKLFSILKDNMEKIVYFFSPNIISPLTGVRPLTPYLIELKHFCLKTHYNHIHKEREYDKVYFKTINGTLTSIDIKHEGTEILKKDNLTYFIKDTKTFGNIYITYSPFSLAKLIRHRMKEAEKRIINNPYIRDKNDAIKNLKYTYEQLLEQLKYENNK